MAVILVNTPHPFDLTPHVVHAGVAVESRRNDERRAGSDQGQDLVEIEGQPILFACKEAESRDQAVQVRVLPDTFHTPFCGIPSKRIEPGDYRQCFDALVHGSSQQANLSPQ